MKTYYVEWLVRGQDGYIYDGLVKAKNKKEALLKAKKAAGKKAYKFFALEQMI